MALFEGYDRRIKQITSTLEEYGIASLEEAEAICKEKGLDIYQVVKDVQPICFENACWAYLLGAAIAIKKGQNRASDIAETLGVGFRVSAFPVPWPMTGRWVWGTATWPPCCSKRRPNVLRLRGGP
jgi:hypothetical protein